MFFHQRVVYCRKTPSLPLLQPLRVVRMDSPLTSITNCQVPLKTNECCNELLSKGPPQKNTCKTVRSHEKTSSPILLTNVSWREHSQNTETTTVLTPGSIIRRLEVLFPPMERKKKFTKGPVSESKKYLTDMSSVLCDAASHTSKHLQPCCKPVPWHCVCLHRAGTDPTRPWTPYMRDQVQILTTSAVYNVLIPPKYLCTSSKVRFKEVSTHQCLKNRAQAFQHIGILHHIPGLPDPGIPIMNLEDYVNYLQHFCSQNSPSESETTAAHFSTQKGLNNRDVKRHSFLNDLFLLHTTDGAQSDEADAIQSHNGVVGVWIVHPWEESVFFAVRYRLGFDYCEWIYGPKYATYEKKNNVEEEKYSIAKVMSDSMMTKWSWAQEPLQNATKSKIQHLPSALYYYATGVKLSEEEKGCTIAQMLGSDKPYQVTKLWTPLPRSTRLLRSRNLMKNPMALAEELKYGLLRIFTV